jgi:hypothetical protein
VKRAFDLSDQTKLELNLTRPEFELVCAQYEADEVQTALKKGGVGSLSGQYGLAKKTT